MGKYKICNCCHSAFDSKLEKCPICGRKIETEKGRISSRKEGDGRIHHAGGAACEYCPHCEGNANWCPFMDD